MALTIVGSGLGRTGTKSMHTALNMLGFGPCHHMVEVFRQPERIPLWIAAGEGRADWDAIFDGFNAMVDYPGAAYWRELAAYYPDAKVLHTARDPDQWFESTQATIFAPDSPLALALAGGEGPLHAFFASFTGPFRAHIHDRGFMTDYFRRHTQSVIDAIAKERLLVYEVGQGWEPLCAFLGVAVPDAAYPSENTRTEFQAHLRGS